ncbi:MAG: glycosyltransferase [Dokdonella sp.]
MLFIGKRFYTNRDALRERYGRIYQLPWHWADVGLRTRLWLIDYHSREKASVVDGALDVLSTPVFSGAAIGRAAVELFSRKRIDEMPRVVVASGDCYIGLLAYRIARRLRARLVFDVYDKYDEFEGYHRFFGFDSFDFLLRRADARLFASRALMENLGANQGSNHLVPNGLDSSRFRPLDRLASRRALGLAEDTSIVGYFGGMEPDRGVQDLIAAVSRLRARGSPLELLLGGKPPADLDLNVPGVRFAGDVPYERMPAMLASCDLLAIPYRRSAFMDAGASNKIAEAIACQRPIVATRTPNLTMNFPEQAERLGELLAEPGDSEDLARAIQAQLAERRMVHMPPGMDWSSISATLAAELALTPEAPFARRL